MNWGAPIWLSLLWGIPALAVFLFWEARRRRQALELLASTPTLAALLPRGLERSRAWRGVLLLLGLTGLIVALAQPRYGFRWVELERKGIDLCLVLDVSTSMDATDVAPSRLERARREVVDILQAAPGDRVGLVVFAGGAYPRVPLTLDHDALRTILRDVDTSTLKAQGTSLAGAIDVALKLLDQPAPSSRAILILSDGETEDAPAAFAAADRAKEASVPIYAIGTGSLEGAPIPLQGGGFKKDRQGGMVVSRMNEDLLKGLAARTGGAYVRSVASADDVTQLVNREIHERLEATSRGSRREKEWNERFQWPLGWGLLALLLSALPAPRRLAPLVLVLCLGSGVANASPRDEGRLALQAGDTEKAIELLTRATLQDPGDPKASFLLGEAYYRAGRFNEAERTWGRIAATAKDPALRALAEYNRGNAAYGAGRLTEAAAAFEASANARTEAGKADGKESESARRNAEAVAREIAARLQEPPPQEGRENPQEGQQGQQGQQTSQAPDAGSEPESPEGSSTESADATGGTRDEASPQESGLREGAIQDAGGASDEGASEGVHDPEASGGNTMTPEQAARLVDAVEEGSPRVILGGDVRRAQDW